MSEGVVFDKFGHNPPEVLDLKHRVFRSGLIIVVYLLVVSLIFPWVIGSKSSNTANAAVWYNQSWQGRTAITINHTKVTADLTDFPVLISSTNAIWADTGHGGQVAQTNGNDFLFTSSDTSTKIPHEIEKYDSATGQLIAWVKVPAVSSTVDTVIYLYFGNASCGSQQSATDVWSAYRGVWHLTEDQAGSGNAGLYKDSTANHFDGDDDVSATDKTGLINLGQKFGAGTDHIPVVQNVDSSDTASTLSYWFKPSVTYNSTTERRDIITAPDYYNTLNSEGDGKLYFFIYSNNGNTNNWVASTTNSWTAGTWYHIVAVHNTSGVYLYVNGNLEGSRVVSFDAYRGNPATGNLNIVRPDGFNMFDGSLDEVRFMSGSAVSDGWAMAETNNQNSPSTFYTIGDLTFGDTTPPTNPDAISGYNTSGKTAELTSGNWDKYAAPYFEFSGATDDITGVKGYYVYFGTSNSADPYAAGVYQAHGGAVGVIQHYTSSAALVEGSTYYLRIITEDNTNNRALAETKFTYKYDPTAPSAPEYINATPTGCSTASSFTFTYPAGTDATSGVAGYEYKLGSTGTVQDTTELTVDGTSYQEGDNVFYVRTVDNAGNNSAWQTAIYCSTVSASVAEGPTVVAGPSSLNVSWNSNKKTTSFVKVYEGNTYISEQGQSEYTTTHSVAVIGLKSEKAYRYKLAWIDSEGNTGESQWYETTTTSTPQVTDLKAEEISPTEMLLSWSTNYSATCSIGYGIGGYSSTESMPGQASLFSKKLTNLTAGSSYQFRVKAVSSDESEFSAGITFATPPLPAVSGLKIEPIPDRVTPAVNLTWNTNIETTSSVFYGEKGSTLKEITHSEKVKDHQIEVADLANSTTYEFQVKGIDKFGNTATSDMSTYTTGSDTRPPVISDITIETSNVGLDKQDKAQIVVSWKTDEVSTSQVEYDEGLSGDSYTNRTAQDKTLTNSHLVIIPGLTPSKPYHLRVITSDKDGNISTSGDQTTIPGDVPKSLLQTILNTFNKIFGWMNFIK